MNPEDTPQDGPARPTNLADLLAELTQPPEPAPISLVPQTIGWPILLVLLVSLAGFLVWRIVRHRRAEAYRRTALAALETAGADPADVARILRQTALTAYPRTDVASLYGADWLAFLATTCPGADFRDAAGEALVTAPYAQAARLPETSLRLVRHWITHHARTGAP